MRIAILTNAYPPHAQGGAGRIVEIYVTQLRAFGHEVCIWGPREAFYQLFSKSLIARLFFHLHDLLPRRKIAEEICLWRPDVLWTHNLTGCGFGTASRIQNQGFLWVHTLHDLQLIEPSGQILAGESWTIFRRMWRFLWSSLRITAMGKPDHVISPTRWTLDVHQGYGWFRSMPTWIIPNPIVRPFIQKNIHQIADQLIYVGRLDADKGIDTLVSIWPSIRSQVSSWIILGEGSWKKRLQDLEDSKIHVLGQRTSEEVFRYLQESSILLVPSRVMETQPTVILEALAAGCRVIGSRNGGIPETGGDLIQTVPPESAAAWSDAILSVLNQSPGPEWNDRREQFLQLHDPESCTERVVEVLKSNLKTVSALPGDR